MLEQGYLGDLLGKNRSVYSAFQGAKLDGVFKVQTF